MSNKFKATIEKDKARHECKHYWIIESPGGATSMGVCKFCGAKKEFENYPGCNFIKREFFVGEDDDDTNKDIHVVVLVQEVDEKEKITVQVTYMERKRGRPVVGIARYIKIFSYFVQGDQTDIIKSDYDAKEEALILAGVLQAIKNKKKLLKEL